MEGTILSADEKILLIQREIKQIDDEMKKLRKENNLIMEELNKLNGVDIKKDINTQLLQN